jgi:predicted Fe-Mo cluster-binding NifX family protein
MAFRIALSSTDGTEADLHFGAAERFYILSVDEQSGVWEIAEQRSVPPRSAGNLGSNPGNSPDESLGSSPGGCPGSSPGRNPSGCLGGSSGGCIGHSDERLDAVTRLLGDCSYVLTAGIGKKPHLFLKRAGITALEVPADLATAISKLTVYHKRYAGINKERN